MCEYNEYEEDLYYEYGEGFEEDLNTNNNNTIVEDEYDEPLDTSVLNSKNINKYRLDDYFLVREWELILDNAKDVTNYFTHQESLVEYAINVH